MIADVRLSCGRHYLAVAGLTLAMEGDPCRDSHMPERVLPPIPDGEMATATIGGKPVRNMPRELIRFFRGDNWTKEMLEWACNRINATATSMVRGE